MLHRGKFLGPACNGTAVAQPDRHASAWIAPHSAGDGKSRSGGPVGSRHRQQLNGEFISALLRDFRQGGAKAIERVRRTQPAAYMKICALLVPKEMKLEHSAGIKSLTDEQLEQAIAALEAMIAAQASEGAKVVEGSAAPAALPAPEAQSSEEALEAKPKRKTNRLMMEADTAIGPRERKPRKVPSPAST